MAKQRVALGVVVLVVALGVLVGSAGAKPMTPYWDPATHTETIDGCVATATGGLAHVHSGGYRAEFVFTVRDVGGGGTSSYYTDSVRVQTRATSASGSVTIPTAKQVTAVQYRLLRAGAFVSNNYVSSLALVSSC